MNAEHRVAIITGGAAGIGRACAIRFAREGYKIVIGDVASDDGLQTLATLEALGAESREKIGTVTSAGKSLVDRQGLSGSAADCPSIFSQLPEAVFEQGTITDENFCQRLAEIAIERWGRIDVLVANAANRNFSRVIDATGREWDEMLEVNLKGTAFSCKAVLPHMIRQGSGAIVLISSVHHQMGRKEMPIYDATKAGIVSMTKSLAVDHAADGIRVNAICPGLTITDFHIRKAIREGRSVDELKRTKVGVLRRPADPSEIAAAVYFMASDEASFITGQALMVDGGSSI